MLCLSLSPHPLWEVRQKVGSGARKEDLEWVPFLFPLCLFSVWSPTDTNSVSVSMFTIHDCAVKSAQIKILTSACHFCVDH